LKNQHQTPPAVNYQGRNSGNLLKITRLQIPQFTIVLMIIKQLLDILVCPVPECRKPLTLAADESSLQCTGCGRVYPVRDGIPILLIDQAQKPQ
jgi:uncharacterized protein YbaR (Trm112 family)